MEESAPPINEAVGFLGRFAPHSLDQLRRALPPEMGSLLSVGGLAGPTDALLVSRAEVARVALTEVIARCQTGIASAERRLKLSRRIRLVGELAAVLGSASVVTTASAVSPTWTVASGVVALIGALAAVVAEYAVKLPQENNSSLFETYAWLIEARFDAKQIAGEIDLLIHAGASNEHDAELVNLVGKSNTLCREAHRRLAFLLSQSESNR
jgi:hypothetical protein